VRTALWLTVSLAVTGWAQGNYTDPKGRFSLKVPAGWSITLLNADAVSFASGNAFATLMVFTNNVDPAGMLRGISQQTGAQWKNFTEVRRGDTRFGGRTGPYITFSGINPKGLDSYLQMLAVTDGVSTYVLLNTAPKNEYGKARTGFDQIEQSFAFGGSKAAAPPPAPALAPASAGAMPAPSVQMAATRPTPPGSGSGGNFYRMKRVAVIDEHGFERPIPALSLLIPNDWKFESQVTYARAAGCKADLVRMRFLATSPDGKMAIELLPGRTWQWADDQNAVRMMQMSNQQTAQFGGKGCDIGPPQHAGDFVQRQVIPTFRQGSRVMGVERIPEVEQMVGQQIRQLEQQAAQAGLRMRIQGDVGKVRLERSVNGQPAEEWITALTFASGTVGPTYNVAMGGMGQTTYYTCGAELIFGLRAPKGELDAKDKFFMMVLSTVKVDPQWQARVNQVLGNISAAETKGAADRSKIIAQNGRDISNIINQTYENSSKSHDRAMEGWSQYMRGVETFRNPSTGEMVELDNKYGNAWAGANGQYILSDQVGFDPNTLNMGNWTRMEQVRR
jgi:hypothetical protein